MKNEKHALFVVVSERQKVEKKLCKYLIKIKPERVSVGGFGKIIEWGVEGDCQNKQACVTELSVVQLCQITS